MFDKEKLDTIHESYQRWEETTLRQRLAAHPERKDKFITASSKEVERLYTPLDIANLDYEDIEGGRSIPAAGGAEAGGR